MIMPSYNLFLILCCAVHFTFQEKNVCPQNGQSQGERNGTYPKWEKMKSSFTYINITWRMVGNYSQENIKSFTLFYTLATEQDWKSASLPSNSTNYVVKSLEPAKTYRFQLAALMNPDEIVCSDFKKSKTIGWGKPCDCNPVGSNSTKCDMKDGQCPCRNKGTVGRTCNECEKKWIWYDKLGCVKCGCAEDDKSKGTCHNDENNIQQCDCFDNFGGPNCQSCRNGYYASADISHNCIPCECNNNTDPSAKKICDPKTGECLACSFNTEGANCETCKEGYEGSGVYKNCTIIGLGNPIHTTVHRSSHSLTIIIGICVSIGVVIVLMVGICMARRTCWRKPPMQLWTVELKDDHENVSFNSMLENPEYQNVNASLLMDDVQFYGHNTPVYQPVVEKAELRRKFDGGMSYHTLGDKNPKT